MRRYSERMNDEAGKKFQVGAYFMLAGGFVLSAIATLKNLNATTKVNKLAFDFSGDEETKEKLLQLPKVALPTGKSAEKGKNAEKAHDGKTIGRPKLKQYDITDIDTRVGLIGELIRKGSLSPDLRERTVALLAQKCDAQGRVTLNGDRYCVQEKDCLGEIKVIFSAIRDPKSKYAVRYTRDAILADVFTAPERTLLKSHGGDCDDFVITLGSMLMAVGHPVRLRVVATKNPKLSNAQAPWSHIYLLTPTTFDNPNAKWISVDGSMNKPLGWEAPGAAEVARTGKPAGIIARVRDYTLLKPSEQT